MYKQKQFNGYKTKNTAACCTHFINAKAGDDENVNNDENYNDKNVNFNNVIVANNVVLYFINFNLNLMFIVY